MNTISCRFLREATRVQEVSGEPARGNVTSFVSVREMGSQFLVVRFRN